MVNVKCALKRGDQQGNHTPSIPFALGNLVYFCSHMDEIVVHFSDKVLYYNQLISAKAKIGCRDLALFIPGTHSYTLVAERKLFCDTMISTRAGTQTAGFRVQQSEY